MSDINWNDGAVCCGDGRQWFVNTGSESDKLELVNNDGTRKYSLYGIINYPNDFQLNEIITGDYIPASELDTEQKYNEVVEVFGLFGFELFGSYESFNRINDCNNRIHDCLTCKLSKHKGLICIADRYELNKSALKRQLTYSQIIAIGKLKRMMLEREKPAIIDDNSVQAKLSNIGNVLHNISCSESDEGVQMELGKYADFIWDLSKSMVNEKSAPKTTPDLTPDLTKASSNKYEREITDRQGNIATVDVYDVLKAFNVTCPATQHAVKKLLCSGLRGHKDLQTDLIEARESIVRAIELN